MSTYIWTGAANDGNWSDVRNWQISGSSAPPSSPPGQNDAVQIGSSSGSPAFNLSPSSIPQVQSIQVYAGSTLTISSPIQVQTVTDSGGTINFASGASGNNITLNVNSGTTNIASSGIQLTQAAVQSAGTLAVNNLTNYSMSNINVFGGTFELNNTSLSGFSGSNVQNNGQIVLNNGSNMTVSNLQCQVTVNSGSTLALTGNYNSGAHVVYGTGTGNTVLVSSGASQTNLPISNISNGDKIGVNGATVSSATYSDSSGSGPIVLHTTSGQTYTYSDVTYGSDVVRGTSFSAGIQGGDAVICFLSGSMIRTPAGDVAVEDIEIGDQVLAFDWQNNQDVVRPVVWVGKASAKVRARLPDDEAGWPVRVLKDAISDGVPYKDMLITAEHCLFFEGRFVPVRMLVNGVSIFYDKSITSYDYYHVETAEHSVITADGMLTESYLDTGNRSSFRQEGKVATLRATGTRSWSHDAAAPLCVERSFVEPLFRYLETREDQVEGCQTPAVDAVQTTQDPGLHLVMSNGAVIRPIRHQGQDYSFMLPAGVDSVRIVSRVSRPSEVIGPFVDDRRSLGVAVGAICFTDSNQRHQITTHLDGGASEGWHDAAGDSGYVWTKGNALLPLAAQTGGVMGMLTITAVPAEQYSVAPVQTPAALRHSA